MWKPYTTVIAEWAKDAINILDRFHIMAHFSKAIDEVRASEARDMRRNGYEPILKRSRWCLLKRPENLTEKQEVKLDELLQYNLRSVRAYLPQGGLPGLLGVRLAGVGRQVPGPLVYPRKEEAMAVGDPFPMPEPRPVQQPGETHAEYRARLMAWLGGQGSSLPGGVPGAGTGSLGMAGACPRCRRPRRPRWGEVAGCPARTGCKGGW